VDEEAMVMLSDILPTSFECGVLNGRVQPGGSLAIVGAGPVAWPRCSLRNSTRRRGSS
jgi:alcohol dehydrogenase